MITLVTGPPGSGKTYFAMRAVNDAILSGKVVVTNVPLSDDWAERIVKGTAARRSKKAAAAKAARYRRNLIVLEDMDELRKVRVRGKAEGRALAVIDEAGSFLNPRRYRDADRMDNVTWFQKHRHYGFDVLLISQLPALIDPQVRDLYEIRITLRNLKNFRLMGLPIFPGHFFVAIHTWNSRDRNILKRDSYKLSKRIAGMYDTHVLSATKTKEEYEPGSIIMPRDPEEPLPPTTPRPPVVKASRRRSKTSRPTAAVDFLEAVNI